MSGSSKPQRKAPAGTITGDAMDLGWQTPPELWGLAAAYWGGRIPFDAATVPENPTNALAFATPAGAGPSPDWSAHGRVWINPPFGRELKHWLAKVVEEHAKGTEIIALLPSARWEQRYFQDALYLANAVTWIRKRVKFIRPSTGDRVGGNPYANMFIGWNVDPRRWSEHLGRAGMTQQLSPLNPCPDRLEVRGATP